MTSLHSVACCTVPPVVGDGYESKGKYITVNGMKTYATGPSSAKKGILVIFDIFGFFPQTLQGADILSTGDKENNYQVFMPDWFEGKPADISWYPPKTEEAGQKLGEFFKTTAAPPKTVQRIPKVLDELKKNTSIETWAIMGYCWGGKIVNLSTQKGTSFKAGVACHPAMVDAGDAAEVTVPYLMIPSGDEDKDDVKKWQEAIKTKNKVEWFPDNVHGFMAARSDLNKKDEREAFEKGYKLVLDFLHEYV